MAELDDRIRNALEGRRFWSLATINPDGTPQNTHVWVLPRDDGKILVNTLLARKKHRNLSQNPNVALAWYDPESPYDGFAIQGRVVDSYAGPQAEADIDTLAKKYLGEDSYPWRKEGDERVTYLIEPVHISS
jgi:PPOX class probable F420-dependent enzyme